MSYKSEAQRAKFHMLAKEGKLKQSVVDEFDKASEGKKLPDRLSPNPRPKTISELRDIAKKKLKK